MGKQSGFSLIELMMVVAIIGILTMVALPAYRSHVADGTRSEGQQMALAISNKMNQYLLDARAYTDKLDATGLNMVMDGWTCTAAQCENANFTVAVSGVCATEPCPDPADLLVPPQFLVTLTGKADSPNDGESFTVDQTGAKTATIAGVTKNGWK